MIGHYMSDAKIHTFIWNFWYVAVRYLKKKKKKIRKICKIIFQ